MHWTQKLNTPGEHKLLLDGQAGKIEAVLTVAQADTQKNLTFLGHPNPLQGGSMQNKVVTTIARACRDRGLPSLRMNFRGVGASEGVHDYGNGESEDMLEIVREWQRIFPSVRPVFAGFSFGSYVACRAAAQIPHQLLLSVAPAVDRHDYKAFDIPPTAWEIIMGEADEVVPFSQVQSFAKARQIKLHPFPDTGHFFHGRLITLRETVINIFKQHGL